MDTRSPECDEILELLDGDEMESAPRRYLCRDGQMLFAASPAGGVVDVDDVKAERPLRIRTGRLGTLTTLPDACCFQAAPQFGHAKSADGYGPGASSASRLGERSRATSHSLQSSSTMVTTSRIGLHPVAYIDPFRRWLYLPTPNSVSPGDAPPRFVPCCRERGRQSFSEHAAAATTLVRSWRRRAANSR